MRIEIVRGTFIDGQPHAAGAVVEVDDSAALALLQMGKAKPAPARPESAVAAPAETAVMPRPAPKDVRARTSVFVSEVPGIGDEMAQALTALGIETVAQLLAADEATLTGIKGVGKATARKWLAAAQEMVG